MEIFKIPGQNYNKPIRSLPVSGKGKGIADYIVPTTPTAFIFTKNNLSIYNVLSIFVSDRKFLG